MTTLTRPNSIMGLPSHQLRPANISAKQASKASKGIKVVFKPTSPAADNSAQYVARKATERKATARIVTNSSKDVPPYTGQELNPYQGRPGSLDFLALPSLIGSTRHYRPGYAPAAITESQA